MPAAAGRTGLLVLLLLGAAWPGAPLRAQEPPPSATVPSADEYWRLAEKRETAQAYRCFLFHYPTDPRAPAATERWAALDFEDARMEDTRSSYRRFERRHPGSPLVERIPARFRGPGKSAEGVRPAIQSDSPVAGRASSTLVGLLKDHDWRVRSAAMQKLMELGDTRGVDALLRALKDSAPQVRLHAAEALEAASGTGDVDALSEALNDSDWFVRLSAARALGAVGDPRAVDGLLEALNDSKWKEREATGQSLVRVAAVDALGEVGTMQAVEALLVAVKDSDSDVRWAAAKALGVAGDARAAEGLLGALKDSVAGVRGRAAEALGAVGDPRAVEGLLEALRDSNPNIRVDAAEALVALGDSRGVDALLGAMKDPEWEARWGAAGALRVAGDPRAVDALLAAMKDPDSNVRGTAAESLGAMGDPRAAAALLGAMKDSDPYVRVHAAEALGVAGDPRGVEALLGDLQDPEWFVRKAAAKALGAVGDARAEGPILLAIDDPNEWVRLAAIEALAKIGGARALESFLALVQQQRWDPSTAAPYLASICIRHGPGRLKEALRSESAPVRQAAAGALALVAERRGELLFGEVRAREGGPESAQKEPEPRARSVLDQVRTAGSRVSMGDLGAVAKLKEGLKSADTEVQLAAIAGLVETREKNPTAIEDLKEALTETRNDTVKLKLTGELAKLGNDVALKGIRGLVKSEDPVERGYAAEILGEANKGEVAEELVKALDDSDPLVRIHAASAILRTLQPGPAKDRGTEATPPADRQEKGGEK